MLVILSMLDKVSTDTGRAHSIPAVGLELDSCSTPSDDVPSDDILQPVDESVKFHSHS